MSIYRREADFREWSRPPTTTEEQKCTNAESVVRNAISSYAGFTKRNIDVFVQGSYRNGTNVRADSDVDICVRCMDVCFCDIPAGFSNSDFGLVNATYTCTEFKNDVEQALKGYLGVSSVSRGKKAFDLHQNTYRIDADVVPTFEHRRYSIHDCQYTYLSGTELHPDGGARIINWLAQNYKNGTLKNSQTGTRFKKLVRVLKRLCNEMVAVGNTAAKSIPSYLIECLVWNAPNSVFVSDQYSENLRQILLHLFEHTNEEIKCSDWGEINELKYLFYSGQSWTRLDVNNFVVAAWNSAGFK